MNDTIAALLYLLGRHVTTFLRVRREDEEIVLNRRQAPPLRELHEALDRGEQLAIDPWVDLDDGTRGLVCLWARTTCPDVTVDDLPAALRPQLWVQQGGSALAVWSLAAPTGRPGGVDPSHAMREIAEALGITACDPRDYIPVPRDPEDLVLLDPGRDIDAGPMVEWAQGVLTERRARDQQRRAHQETATRTALTRRLVTVLAAITEQCRERDALAAYAAIASTRDGDAHEEELRPSQPGKLEERGTTGQMTPDSQPEAHGGPDPWAIALPADDISAHEGLRVAAPEPQPREHTAAARAELLRAHTRRAMDASPDHDGSAEVRGRLEAAIADARKGDQDTDRLQILLVQAMAELGTQDVWAALGVTMTLLRHGTLYGFREEQWICLRDLLTTG